MPFGAGLDEFFDERKTESTQPISVGNHNFSDMTFDCGVQNGFKPFSLEIDARSNVSDNFVVRVLTSEELSLSFQIFFLRSCGYASVADVSSGIMVTGTFPGGLNASANVSFMAASGSGASQFPAREPVEDGFGADVEAPARVFGSHELFVFRTDVLVGVGLDFGFGLALGGLPRRLACTGSGSIACIIH